MNTRKKPIILISSFREPSAHGGDLERDAAESSYVSAVLAANGNPLVVPYGAKYEDITELALIADGLLLPGGGDIEPAHYGQDLHEKTENVSKERDELELSLVKAFLEKRKPIFGVCRGAQILNVAMGGSLCSDIECETNEPLHHWKKEGLSAADQFPEDSHSIEIEDDSVLAEFFGLKETVVNSLHHQSIKAVASGLRIGARSNDGIIEGIESVHMNERWLLGVQWHPEAILERHPENKILFERFIEASRRTMNDPSL